MTSPRGFGRLLRTHRLAAGLTQRQLAERASVSVAAIRDLEQGRSRTPRPSTVRALAEAVGVTGPAAARLSGSATVPDPSIGATVGTPGRAGAGPLQVLLLGPLIVRHADTELWLPAKGRAVVARLALSANATVTVDGLTELLWPARAPKSPAGAVQAHVSRLRAAIGAGSGSALRRGAAGYRLLLSDDQLDLAAFRRAVRDARAAADRPTQALDVLRSGLRRWRGEPLVDVPELRTHPLVTAVAEERIRATLLYADLAGLAGCPGRALPELRTVAVGHPLHEPVHARIVTALAAVGLRAEALATYQQIRARLSDELGMDPGDELIEAHRRVLRHRAVPLPRRAGTPRRSGPDANPAPAGLPAASPALTGRRRELDRLDDLVDAGRGRPTPLTVALSGAAGTGKTLLALHWAHRVRHRFPDGQLYADLRGFHPSGAATPPTEILRSFLEALAVPPDRVPAGADARVALYRSLLDRARVLVMLDNARDAEQVRPLLPAGRHCLTLITSRDPLTALVAADGAEPVSIDRPGFDDARQQLVARLGSSRVTAESAAVEEIVVRCDRLPLALAVIGARAVTAPVSTLGELAADLRRAPLDGLTTGDPRTDVRASLSWSYRLLDAPSARMFVLFGLVPPGAVPVDAAASLAGVPRAAVRQLLAALVRTRLLVEPRPGRFELRGLPRAYAGELLADVALDDRRVAWRRFVDHHLHTGRTVAALLEPGDRPEMSEPGRPHPAPAAPPWPGTVVTRLVDKGAALDWLVAEQAMLRAVTSRSAAIDQGNELRALCRELQTQLGRSGRRVEQAVRARLAAGQRRNSPSGTASAIRW